LSLGGEILLARGLTATAGGLLLSIITVPATAQDQSIDVRR
jgi:hypothetical protein